MTETWYLLYGGDSVDGCGPGEYEGRTSDVSAAAKHYIKIIDNPYSTGSVQVITDKEVVTYSPFFPRGPGNSFATYELHEAIQQQQPVETPREKLERLIQESGDQELIEAFDQLQEDDS